MAVKLCMEKIVPLKGLKNPDVIIKVIELTAEEASKDGWFFVSTVADDWLESVTLFFEKDVEV
jgi:hypothetical protein